MPVRIRTAHVRLRPLKNTDGEEGGVFKTTLDFHPWLYLENG
jgi:hypothetical protein